VLTNRRKKKQALWAAFFLILLSALVLFLWFHRRHPAPASSPPPAQRLAEDWLAAHYPTLLTPAQLQQCYETLIHGYFVPQTGLFMSFPGTGDLKLIQQAATYDEGIVGVLLLKLGDLKKARSILGFYERAWAAMNQRCGPREGKKGFANFYNAYFSVEGIEKTMHVGPNAWIGLLASRYYRRTGDRRALALALNIARWIIDSVPHDHGAVAMGQIPWNSAPWNKIHSTENNLSTYAFMKDLSQTKGLTRTDRSAIQRETHRIRAWLIDHAYDRRTGTVIRGFHPKGIDNAGAIDSYTWYLGALGPRTLSSHGIPPAHLMSLTAKDYGVKVGDHLGIDCVDQRMADATYEDDLAKGTKDPLFLRPANDHHRLIWFEGQNQYIVTLQEMARYSAVCAFLTSDSARRRGLLNQASQWLDQARLFVEQIDQSSFEMPWGRCYPCATPGRFYVYGWPAPRAAQNHPSDAVAPLVWRLFSGMGYDPLTDKEIAPQRHWSVHLIPIKSFRDPGTPLLYGASEEMTVRAWQLYEQKDYEGAGEQARATIELWEDDAQKLEKLKEKEVGGYLPYDGRSVDQLQRIHDYWALNDVAASYFILAKIEHARRRYDEARKTFALILHKFPLAQMWDKSGWFWNPADSIRMDFAEVDTVHYGSLMAMIPNVPLAEDAGSHPPLEHPKADPTVVPSAH
jgi:hypothetical protein